MSRSLLVVLALVSLVTLPARAAEFVRVGEVKSRSDDAARIVTNIVEGELGALDPCGEKYMAGKPPAPGIVTLKVRLQPGGAVVMPAKAADAERREVACVGKHLAGLEWPKPSGKVDVVVEFVLAPTGKRGPDEGEELAGDEDDEDLGDGEVVDLDELEDEDDDEEVVDLDELDEDDEPKRDDRAERERREKERAEKERREERAEKERRDAEREERREREERAERRDRSEKRDRGSKDGPDWRNARVGYVASSLDGDFDAGDVTEAFDKLLGDIDKEWRRAKAFHAMVRVRVDLDDDGGASSVRVVKSRDADDFEDAVARIVEDLRVRGARGGSLEWTLAFKR